jgi:hypothetical protein
MSQMARVARMSVVVPEALLYARRPAAAGAAAASLMFLDRVTPRVLQTPKQVYGEGFVRGMSWRQMVGSH